MVIDGKQYSGKCACGLAHHMETMAAIIEADALTKFEDYMDAYHIHGKRCALYGERAYQATEGKHPFAEQTILLDSEGLHADEHSTAYVLQKLEKDIEIIVAIGSGTIHDIARFCANERKIRFVSVPTAASVDGFCSTVAAMTWHGYKKTLPSIAPEIVIADVTVIKHAPERLIRSGVGDIIAKFTALADWKIAHALTGEHFCPRIYHIMHDAARTVVDSVPDILDGRDQAYEHVMYALIMSGIAMQMMGNSRPASGAEHHISHMIESRPLQFPVAFDTGHGEKTGVGSVLAAEEYHRLASFKDIRPYLSAFYPIPEEQLSEFFGPGLAQAVIEENREDCLKKVTPESIAENWPVIRKAIEEVPSSQKIYSVLERLGAKRTLEDIGVSQEQKAILLEYSPLIRNRLTLMRAKRMIKA